MLSAFLNLNVELMTSLLITITVLIVVLGRIYDWSFIVERPVLVSTSL